MFPAKFDYYRANSVEEAIDLLQENSEAKILAGGHSLLPTMKLRLAMPSALIDIGRITNLNGVTQDDGLIRIGALTPHASIAASDVLRKHATVLAEAAANIGDPAVRNKGTLGGNLAHADPASDPPAAVLALGGTVVLAGPTGERRVAATDFFVDLLATDLEEYEILTAVEIPMPANHTGSAYVKFEHPASGYAICGAAAVITLNGEGTCQAARLAFNGITAKPFNGDEVADTLVGKKLDEAAIEQAVDHNLHIDDPMGDIHASGPYRVQLAKVQSKRALKLALNRAQQG